MKNKYFYLFIILFFISEVVCAQSSAPIYEWAKGMHGSGGIKTCVTEKVVTDTLGNSYAVGVFDGTVDFDPSSTGTYSLTSNGELDIFVLKLNEQGNFVWAKQIGGTEREEVDNIAIDNLGNVTIVGTFNDTVDFNPNSGVFNMISHVSGTLQHSAFVLQLNGSGNFNWAYGVISQDAAFAYDLAIDSTNNIYVTGSFLGTTTFGLGTAAYSITPSGIGLSYILKFTNAGVKTWLKTLGGINNSPNSWISTNLIELTENDEIIIYGRYEGLVDFNPGPVVDSVPTATAVGDFILKLSNSGGFLWVKTFGGGLMSSAKMSIDNQQNILLVGHFGGFVGFPAVDFDPDTAVANLVSSNGNTVDYFILKLDSLGVFERVVTSNGPDKEFIYDVEFDDDGNMYTIGRFKGIMDFDPGSGTQMDTAQAVDGDMFIYKLDSAGNYVWVEIFPQAFGYGMDMDFDNNLVICGATKGIVDFNPSLGTNNLFTQGYADGFVAKYSQCHATYTSFTTTVCNSYTSPSGLFTWDSTGVYYDTLSNSRGCDSIISINLITNKTYNSIYPSVCSTYTSPSGIHTWSNTGTFYDTLTNSIGCDSILTIHLWVNTNDTIFSSLSCGSYTSPSGAYVWTTSGLYHDTVVNSMGCDSVLTILLSIGSNNSSTQSISSCNSYTWLVNGETYNASGQYHDTLVNASGCDSIITLDLTINTPSSATDVISSCTPITWIDGIVYDQSISGPTFIITNANGCDSVVTLDLTILNVDTSVTRNYLTLTAQASNATYQWIDCDNGVMAGQTGSSFTATVNGNYQVEITQNGCVDSSNCFAITNVGVQEARLIGISLYPNPTSEVLNIDKGSNSELEIIITNSAGAVVYQSESKNQITTVNMSQMASGTYIVTLKNQNGLKVERVVKR